MTYDRIKSCYHFVEGECPHQRFLQYVKYHKALLDCLYCGQFINRWPSQNLGNGWSGNKGESGEVLILAD
jgi:hypothetical protein